MHKHERTGRSTLHHFSKASASTNKRRGARLLATGIIIGLVSFNAIAGAQDCKAMSAFAEAVAISRDNGVAKEKVVSDSMTLFAGSTAAQDNAYKFINVIYDNPTVTPKQSNQAIYQICMETAGAQD